jgi:hypothetical protein
MPLNISPPHVQHLRFKQKEEDVSRRDAERREGVTTDYTDSDGSLIDDFLLAITELRCRFMAVLFSWFFG